MVVYLELVLELKRICLFAVGFYSELISLSSSNPEAFGAVTSPENFNVAIAIRVFEIFENSLKSRVGRSVIEDIGTPRMKAVVLQCFETGRRTVIRRSLILVRIWLAQSGGVAR